jgi:type I restriction enzyme S subunit
MDAATAAPTTKTLPDGYQRTEVGVIPKDWNVKELYEIGTFAKGKGIRKSDVLDDGIPCIRYGEIYTKHDEYIKSFHSYISDEDASKAKILKSGDILFAGSGETKEEIGKCVAFLNQFEAYAGGDIVILSPLETDSKFLGFQLNSKSVNKQKAKRGQGDAVVHIYSSGLSEIKIPLPPTLKEQRAIAGALSDVDALIAELDALIEKKQQIKKGAMQQLLTGNKRLPGFSEDWEEKTLGEIGKFQSGNGFPKEHQGEGNGKYPFFKVSDMNNDGNEVKMKTSNNWISENQRSAISANIMPSGSIVFAKIGAAIFLERKKILVQDSCIDNNMMCFIFDRSYYNHEFIHYLFLSIKLGKLTKTSALPSLSGKDISNLVVRMPELKEQKAIARILSDMDAEIQSLQAKRDKYEKIKQGMMQELLTGKTRLV